MDYLKRFNSLKKLLVSSGGFSLIEVMIGGSILVGVGVAGSMLFKNQNKMQNRVNQEAILDRFHNSVAKILTSVHHCNATFQNMYDQTTIGNTDNITQVRLCSSNCTFDSSAQEVIPGMVYAGEGLSIDNNGRNIWTISQINYVLPAVTTTGPLQLRFTYDLNPRIGDRRITKDVIVNLRFSAGQFKECVNGSESVIHNLQKVICDSLTTSPIPAHAIAEWNDVDQKCDLKNINLNCVSPGEAVGGINANGIANCGLITNNPDPLNTFNDCDSKKLTVIPVMSGGVNKLVTQCN